MGENSLASLDIGTLTAEDKTAIEDVLAAFVGCLLAFGIELS